MESVASTAAVPHSPPVASPNGPGPAVSPAAVVRWCLAAFAVAASLMMLTWPLGYDQGVFFAVGDVVARGGAPYRDAWDVKGPLVFYLMAAIQLVFGRHVWAIRVVDLAITLLTAGLFWHRLRSVTSRGAALAVATTWPVLVASFSYHDSAQTDLWVGSAMLGVTLLVTRPHGYRARELALAGGLVGLATLTKPIFPVFLAVPGVVVLMRRRGTLGAAARDLAILVAGWLAPIAAAVAGLWLQGALREAWEVHILYNLRVYAPNVHGALARGSSPTAMRVSGLITYLVQPKVAIVIAPAAAGAVALWRKQRTLAAALLAWLFAGAALVLLQNKFWRYHWEILYPALLVLVAVGVHEARHEARAAKSRSGAVLAAATAAVAFMLWAGNAVIDLRRWLLFAAGRQSAAWYDHTLLQYGEIDPGDAVAAAAYVRAHTAPGAAFAQWTLQAGLAPLTGRPHVSRFFNKRELTNTRDRPITQAYRREYLGRVVDLRPPYLAIDKLGDFGAELAAAGQPFSPLDVVAREFPELAAVVAERYEPAARFGDIDVYRLRPVPASVRPAPVGTAAR